jgi:hypothetical protein
LLLGGDYLTLSELKIHVDEYVRVGHGDDVVLITLSQSSVGARASTAVSCIFPGFDWEHGQMRIEPEKPVCLRGRAKDDMMPIRMFAYSSPRPFYECPCGTQVKKDSHYCQHCGQHLFLDKNAEPYDSYNKKVL